MHPEPTHNAYLSVVGGPANTALSQAMEEMGRAAGAAARSRTTDDIEQAMTRMAMVHECAIAFSQALANVTVPTYMRSADSQLQDAVRVIAHGASRGIVASSAEDGTRLAQAASEIEGANRDVMTAAERIVNWKTGAARNYKPLSDALKGRVEAKGDTRDCVHGRVDRRAVIRNAATLPARSADAARAFADAPSPRE